jgi:hypothetical protein
MRPALAMAAQGEWDEARKVADRLSREALCVLRRFKNGKPSVTCHLSPHPPENSIIASRRAP